MENDEYFSGTSMQKGIMEFLETKGKNVRPDTFRSYHSYLKWFNGFLHRSGKMQMPVKTFTDRDAEKAMKELCYRCLIRPKEILMLKIKDIDFVENRCANSSVCR